MRRVKGAVYKGNLMNYAAFQGSVEILGWLMEEKGWEPNQLTGEWAGMGGSVEVLEYVRGTGYEFYESACQGAARGGSLEALKFLRGQDPPCPWIRSDCRAAAELSDHQHVIDWIDQQEDESDVEYREFSDIDGDDYF